jgi:hypothetical protein
MGAHRAKRLRGAPDPDVGDAFELRSAAAAGNILTVTAPRGFV